MNRGSPPHSVGREAGRPRAAFPSSTTQVKTGCKAVQCVCGRGTSHFSLNGVPNLGRLLGIGRPRFSGFMPYFMDEETGRK